MVSFIICVFIFFLCIGSFFNVVAYRLTFDLPFLRMRSHCPTCDGLISWFDNIPLISWILLKGKCRNCKGKISALYPFIELITAIVMTTLFFKIFSFNLELFFDFSCYNLGKFIAYFVLFAALIIDTRTDIEAMVVSRMFSLWLVPVGLLFSYFNLTGITFLESLSGAIIGFGVLWLVAKAFKLLKGEDGLGEGDMDVLALIGSFLGPIGVWISLTVGSIVGLLIGILYIVISKKGLKSKIPFAPFLALGAFIYVLFEEFIRYFF